MSAENDVNDAEGYIAGLVAADGYLLRREVRIATNDICYARIIMNIINNIGYKPRIARGVRVYLIRIYSKEFKEKLQTVYGINEGRKASKITFPRKINDRVKSYFIAGYFDGDGSIGIVKSGVKKNKWGPYVTPRIVFSSKSQSILLGISEYLQVNGLAKRKISFDGNEIYRLKYYGCRNLKSFLSLFGSKILNPRRIAGARAGANSCREVSC